MAKLLKKNDRSITFSQVRLIGVNGEQHGVVTLDRAHYLAQMAGQDLVLVSDRSDAPVARIMNFGKLQYEQKKNLKAQRKNQLAQKLKEVKFHINIDDHDYETKLKHALDFLEKGCKLKVTLALRGREMAHQDLANELMAQVLRDLAPYADADGTPKMLGRNISVTLTAKPHRDTPKKAAPEKTVPEKDISAVDESAQL